MHGPAGVLSFGLEALQQQKPSRCTPYTVCSLQGNIVYFLALATQVPSLLLSVGYQNKTACICLGQRCKN